MARQQSCTPFGLRSAHLYAAAQILEENKRLSRAAFVQSQAEYPEVTLDPLDGPMASIRMPQVDDKDRVASKYHVVVTADYSVYAAWQTLVR